MKILKFLFLTVISLQVFAQEKDTSKQVFIEIPSGGIPLAQIFDSKVSDPEQYVTNASKVYYIWGASKPKVQAGVISSKYFPSIRNPDKKLTIEWYKQNHPDWIMYQEDKVTPAYGYIYDYGGLTPLDVSNPEVQEFYLNEFILPAVKSGYKMVAMDNVDLGNWPKSIGHFKGDTWIQLYTGKKDDPAFHKSMIDWMQFLSNKLNPLGIRVSANIKATTASPKVILKVINAVDMWVDETGFSHRGENITDEVWKKSFAFLRTITPTKSYVSINQVKGKVATTSQQQIEWIMANFLLSRGPKSLLALSGYEKTTLYHTFDYRKELDIIIGEPLENPEEITKGVWSRKYTKGMTLVNPSSKDSITVRLPPGKFRMLNGELIEKEITLNPASGAVLASK
ncbi:hypothetical protein A5893_16790 [Pedobacter psychrophilus]|uniref:Glycoside-hydrolase family GH114 TIM-barrel domain-containing protein n=1 Tax=Pedobacter psychrophilus TaxID=1826909 RepID=A0A179DBE5_9SPHI|nr:putative glycoside hydrolase [Pedobacter psychrophilus]OAQ38020.1 hypothetical protein A5893_16790 [Pedobacter psychrophilus]